MTRALVGTHRMPEARCSFHILGGQLNSASTLEVCTHKVAGVVCLVNDWEVQAGCLFGGRSELDQLPVISKLSIMVLR
jgi:hypothetical protein